jgi:hypothetical protein
MSKKPLQGLGQQLGVVAERLAKLSNSTKLTRRQRTELLTVQSELYELSLAAAKASERNWKVLLRMAFKALERGISLYRSCFR